MDLRNCILVMSVVLTPVSAVAGCVELPSPMRTKLQSTPRLHFVPQPELLLPPKAG